MARQRVDIGALIEENRSFGISIPMISVASGFTVGNLRRLQKDGSVIVSPKSGTAADLLGAFTETSRVLGTVIPHRFVYQWWHRQNASLDHHRPIDLHVDDPQACRRAAAHYAEEHVS